MSQSASSARRTVPAIHVPHHHQNGLPVVVGCPLPAGDHPGEGAPHLQLRDADGQVWPLQVAPLTGATISDVRWWELSFLAKAGGELQVEPVTANGKPRTPIASMQAGDCMLDNGDVRISLHTDPSRADGALISVVSGDVSGELWPEMRVPPGRLALDRATDPADRCLTILRNGPQRAQVQITGRLTDGQGVAALDYRLTVELWAGQRGARIDFMLMHVQPGVPNMPVESAKLAGRWQVGGGATRRFVQTSHGPFYRARQVLNAEPVSLVTDFDCATVHVADPAMLLDDTVYAHYLAPPTIATADWLALQGDAGAVVATVQDFTASRPNALSSQADRLDYQFIPEGHALDWPQGRRREQSLLLAFADPATTGGDSPHGPDLTEALRLLGVVKNEMRALPSPATLKAYRCFDIDTVYDDNGPQANTRLSMLLEQACRLDMPADKWNLGDTRDSGYTTHYAGSPHSFLPHPALGDIKPQFSVRGGLYPSALANWVEPVWTNNEYDIIHGLAVQLMRTGSLTHATTLRWTTRHHVEVDFMAYNDDPWHNRAVPFHSHFHNSKGAIPSHFWTQGLLQYYCLTGDRDAHEMAIALGDKILEIINNDDCFIWQFDREIGWALLALVCLVEAGYDKYRPECDRAVDYLMAYDRAGFSGAVKLSSGNADRSLERQLLDNAFGYVSIIEGVDRYQKISGRADTADWLETLLLQLKDAFWNSIRDIEVPEIFRLSTHILAIGYERTDDEDFIRAALVVLEGFFARGLTDGHNHRALGEVKPSAMFMRSLYRFLGHAQRLDLLAPYELPTLAARARGEFGPGAPATSPPSQTADRP